MSAALAASVDEAALAAAWSATRIVAPTLTDPAATTRATSDAETLSALAREVVNAAESKDERSWLITKSQVTTVCRLPPGGRGGIVGGGGGEGELYSGGVGGGDGGGGDGGGGGEGGVINIG